MADLVLIALRYMHIVFGVAWIGAAFYGYIVLRTGMGRVPMLAYREAMRQLIPVIVRYVPLTRS